MLVVGADGNKPAPRPVKIGSAQDGQWVVLDGLKAGEQVMVDGFQKMRARRAGEAGAVAAAPAPAPAASAAAPRRPRGLGAPVDGAARMAQFFIDRPIFAWVIALFILVLGGVAITQLPVRSTRRWRRRRSSSPPSTPAPRRRRWRTA